MRRLFLAPILAAALLVPAATADAATDAQVAKCTPKGSKTVKKNKYVRVYTRAVRSDDVTERLYACLYSQGRQLVLDRKSDDGFVSSHTYSAVTLTGAFVAWEATSSDFSCKADCPPGYDPTTTTVTSADLKTRKTLTWEGAVLGRNLGVTRKGAVAWLEKVGDTYTIFKGNSKGRYEIVTNVEPRSFEFSGTTVTFIANGAPGAARVN